MLLVHLYMRGTVCKSDSSVDDKILRLDYHPGTLTLLTFSDGGGRRNQWRKESLPLVSRWALVLIRI